MQCFDHQEEFVGLCGWCGKQVCPRCIGRQDGRKKYCRDCAAKMGDFRSGETKQLQQEPPLRAAPHHEVVNHVAPPLHHEVAHHDEEQPRITPIAPKRPVVALGHPKPVDPKHFTLDSDEPMIFRHDEAPRHHESRQESVAPRVSFHPTSNTPVHHDAPKPVLREALKPVLREAPKHDSGFEPFKPFPITNPQPKVGSAAGSFRPATPGASAASSAMNMFAQSAQQTKNNAPTHSSSPSMHSTTPVHPGASAASSAMNMFAQSAQQTKNNAPTHSSSPSMHSTTPVHPGTGMHASMHPAGPTLHEAVLSGSAHIALPHTGQRTSETDDKPHLQTLKPVTQNSGSGAASKAMSFLAEAAKETAKKKQ